MAADYVSAWLLPYAMHVWCSWWPTAAAAAAAMTMARAVGQVHGGVTAWVQLCKVCNEVQYCHLTC
jgi:hypothetical protein